MTTDSFDLAQAAAALRPTVFNVDGHQPFVVVPDAHTIRSLETLLDAPTRTKGNAVMFDAASFIAQVNDFKRPQSRAYMIPSNDVMKPPTFVVVLNENEPNPKSSESVGVAPGVPLAAGWRDWRVTYAPQLSPEWQTWAAVHKRKMQQIEFAQFIEDNLPDIVDPEAATVLEVSRSIEAKKKVNFASDIRLSNGAARLTFEEEIQGSAAKGTLDIPERIALGIPVFLGGPRYRVEARLRYSITEAKLVLWLDLLRPHVQMQDAIDGVRYRVQDDTGLDVLVGRPD